jgi:hypothetical protein
MWTKMKRSGKKKIMKKMIIKKTSDHFFHGIGFFSIYSLQESISLVCFGIGESQAIMIPKRVKYKNNPTNIPKKVICE